MSFRTLSRLELRWASAALEAIFPVPAPSSDNGIRIGIADLDVEGFLVGTFARAPFEPALGLRGAIWIVALAPLFVLGRLSTIVGLSLAEREDVLVR